MLDGQDAGRVARAARFGRVFVSLSPTIAVVITAVALLAAGCSSPQSAKQVEGFQRTKAALVDAQRQVDMTLATLVHLRFVGSTGNTAGLNEAFKEYKSAVGQLEKEGNKAKHRAKAMKEDVDTYVMTWQKEVEAIKDPAIKASVESRRDAVRSNFSLLRMYADDARKAYQPFLRDNKDLVQALSIDVSPAALKGLEPSIERTVGDGQALKQRLAAFQHALVNIEHGLSPIGETSAAVFDEEFGVDRDGLHGRAVWGNRKPT